jgi:ABC-2 type transport system permease protein
MRAVLAVPLRVLAVVGKELAETIRRPGAILSLVLGPFLIMALFGLGYDGVRRPLETIVVTPAGGRLPTDIAAHQRLAGGGLHVVAVTHDRPDAIARLEADTVDMVVVAPEDPDAAFRAGQQSVIEVIVDEVDPVEVNYDGFLASLLSSAINREVITRVAAQSQGYAVAAGDPRVAAIRPDIVAAPTTSQISNIAPSAPGVIAFFAPAVLALVLQHLAVTLVALSLVRERTSGVIELFRIAPVGTAEIMTGKILAYGLLGSAVAAATIGLLVAGLGVPILGSPGAIALVIVLLLFASLGLGLAVATVSDSERQVVQLSLLVLLASVFFTGFVLSIDEFSQPIRSLVYLLPVSHGIRLLQDLWLRGTTTATWELAALAVIGVVTTLVAWLLLRRSIDEG